MIGNCVEIIWTDHSFISLPDIFLKVPHKDDRANPTLYNGPDPNMLRFGVGNFPIVSLMSNHLYLIGGDGMTSYEQKEYNFGSIKARIYSNYPLD